MKTFLPTLLITLLVGALFVTSSVVAQESTSEEKTANETSTTEGENDLLNKAEELGDQALESGEEVLKKVDENEQVREVADKGIAEVEKLTNQDSPWWYFAAITLSAAAALSFSIQTIGDLFTIFRFKYLDIREVLSDLLAALVSITCLSFVLKGSEELGVVVTSNSMLIGSLALAIMMGLAMGVWGVQQEFEACRTAKLMEELSETQTEYSKLRAKAKRMQEVGRKLVEEKKMREGKA